jgi:hypothetical protein
MENDSERGKEESVVPLSQKGSHYLPILLGGKVLIIIHHTEEYYQYHINRIIIG